MENGYDNVSLQDATERDTKKLGVKIATIFILEVDPPKFRRWQWYARLVPFHLAGR